MLPEFIVSIDIGTDRISVLVGETGDDETMRITGASARPSRGIRKGLVVDMEDAAGCIREAVEHAGRMAGVEVHGVCAGITGPQIRSFNSRGMIPVAGEEGEVTADDLDQVMKIASNITLPADTEVLHSIPQDFVVDGHRGVRDPVGMTASRLGTEIHLVTGQAVQIENTVKVIENAGFDVVNIVFNPIASARAVLTRAEIDAGCLMVDIGAGGSSFVLYGAGTIRASGVLPAGGANVTNDLAVGLRIQNPVAEEIKLRHGLALATLAGADETVQIPEGENGGGEIRREIIAAIIEPRCEEIFSMIKESVEKDPHFAAGGGVILTGGGSRIEGLAGVAAQVFNLPVRIGRPSGLGGLSEIVSNESWSAVVGLVLHERDRLIREEQDRRRRNRVSRWIGNLKKLAGTF